MPPTTKPPQVNNTHDILTAPPIFLFEACRICSYSSETPRGSLIHVKFLRVRSLMPARNTARGEDV
ncbi:hypothetical protein E2C01_081146 [Portunus trituberculatus]|uniref:Uncharacterized protein n=1 Tax=Portunus trituberculatus TaxID=210409 RepID=A0A5B7IVH2_PORTR|nr:hypothetical protein [Portunus trituberculatus]